MKQSPKTLKTFAYIFLVLGLLGFLDASYLTANHYLGTALRCYILAGCDIVTTSKYSMILGIPVSLLGAIYYLLVFVLSIAYLDTKKKNLLVYIFYSSCLGFLMSLVFVFIQIFIIKALCLYCMLSALNSTLLFLLGLLFSKKNKSGFYWLDETEEILKSL